MPGPSKSVDIFLRLHGARKFAKEVEAAGTQLEAMGVKGASAIGAFARKADSLKSFGRSWTKNVSLPVAAFAAVAGKMAIDFHQSMSLIQTQAGATGKETVWLEKRLLKMASNSKFSADELADALFRVRSAGFKKGDAMDVLKEGAALATMGGSNAEMTTKALTGAAKTLGFHKKGAIHGLAAEMNAIVGTGDMKMEELQDALSTGVLPSFTSASLGMRDFGDALTVMTDRNVPAQQAATRLRMAISLLSAPTEKAQEALGRINLGASSLATTMKDKGLPAAIKQLVGHLKGLSSIEKNQLLTEAFGGAKSSGTIKTLVENWQELFVKQKLIGEGLKKYNGELKVAEKQPGTELLKAWHAIEVTMINVGDELLPAIVPGLKDLAGAFITVAHAFTGLPPEVQAVAAGMLILTGPVASGLGYYASGVGKALKFTAKLGRATSLFGSTLSKNTMTQGSGITGAFGAASKEMGLTGALQTAKGFALSLGPAFAAVGIANIVTSATSGDWKDAGWEAGGAVAGGIAGALVGGPLGAMLGVGVGSIGGELLEGLFGSDKKLAPLQEKLAASSKNVKKAFEAQRQAAKSLKASGEAVVGSHKRETNASHAVHRAEQALAQIRKKAGRDSTPVLHAEVELARAAHRRKEAIKAVANAEHKSGAIRRSTMELERVSMIQDRRALTLLGKRRGALEEQLGALRSEGKSAQELRPKNEKLISVNNELAEVHKKLSATVLTGAKVIGPKWGEFLRNAGFSALHYGSKVKAAKAEVTSLTTSLKELVREIGQTSSAFEKGTLQSQALKLREALPGAEENVERLERSATKGKGAGPKKKAPPRANADALNIGAGPGGRKRLKVDGPGVLDRVEKALQINLKTHVDIDGKSVAEATARHSVRKGNRE